MCERSLSGSGAGPHAAASAQFVRGDMLPSGYLVRPCDGGGSIIHIVDHLNLQVTFPKDLLVYVSCLEIMFLLTFLCPFQAWTVPEVLRPLYESSKVVAQKMTIAVSEFLMHTIISAPLFVTCF